MEGGYPSQLAPDLGHLNEHAAAVLVRLRKDRCFPADPDPALAAPTGRPRRHGCTVVCKDPATWLGPSDEHHTADPQYGHVRVRAWADLQAIPQNHAAKGSRGPKPLIRGTPSSLRCRASPSGRASRRSSGAVVAG